MAKTVFQKSNSKLSKFGWLVTLLMLPISIVAKESEQQVLEWPYAKGFYIGGQLGKANTDIDNQSLFSLYSNAGLNPNDTTVDKEDVGYSLFLGYRFDKHWSLEAGYQDLGDRNVEFAGSTSNMTAFYDLAEKEYPETADGWSLSVLGSLPFDNGVTLTGKLGYFDWEMDQIMTELGGSSVTNPGSSEKSDSGVMYGLELGYHFDYEIQGYVSYQFIPLDEDDVNVLSVGFRYWFDDKPQYKAPKVAEPVPVAAKEVQQPVVLKDTDGDGVFDDKDMCPDSPIEHLVDLSGCTQYVVKPVDMKVTIYFPNNSSIIPKEYYDDLADLATFIKKYDVDSLNVVGHTSASGSSDYNQLLSERRAQKVAVFLNERFGISNDVLKPVGKGETELVSDDPSLNRRMEVYIKSDVRMPVLKSDSN